MPGAVGLCAFNTWKNYPEYLKCIDEAASRLGDCLMDPNKCPAECYLKYAEDTARCAAKACTG
jgi:hypothetical protein